MLPETSQPGNGLDDIKLMQRDAQHKELIATLEALTMATMKDKKTELKGAELVTIKGEKGDPGKDGRDGKTPLPGVDFPLPKDGKDGRNPMTVSSTEPQNPQIGDLWYEP